MDQIVTPKFAFAAAASAVLAKNDQNDELIQLLQRWLRLSELERRSFGALCREVEASSRLVETSAQDLSNQFQNLAFGAEVQVQMVNEIIETAQTVTVEGEQIALTTVIRFIEEMISESTRAMNSLSKHAMTMVYSLDDVLAELGAIESSIRSIEGINRQMNLLALNATIEAKRAGEAGNTFMIVAQEVRELSKNTNMIAQKVRIQMQNITTGVREGHATLSQIATTDMPDNAGAQGKLENMMVGLITQNEEFNSVLQDAARTSQDLHATISDLVTNIQFQDRTKQHLEHVVDTLSVLGNAVDALRAHTIEALPSDASTEEEIDRDWLDKIVSGYKLEDVRKRFVSQILAGHYNDKAEIESNGTVELF